MVTRVRYAPAIHAEGSLKERRGRKPFPWVHTSSVTALRDASRNTGRRYRMHFPLPEAARFFVEFSHFHKQMAAGYWFCTGTYRIMCPQNAETSPPSARGGFRLVTALMGVPVKARHLEGEAPLRGEGLWQRVRNTPNPA